MASFEPGPNDHKLFIIHNQVPIGDAQTPILCESCSCQFYSTAANLAKARELGLTPTCATCSFLLIALSGEEAMFSGFINEGRVSPTPTKKR